MSNDTPYQVQPQIDQLMQERANAEAYGQTDRVAAVDKQLASLGVKQKAAEKRSASAEGDKEAKAAAPKGRRASVQTQTAEGSGEA